jgi:nucleoid-associated protein YgaU
MDKSLQSLLKIFKDSEASTSVIFGLIVVVVAGVLLFNYFRYEDVAQVTEEAVATETTQVSNTGESLPATYTVATGDSLWIIAEKYYGSGYNWTDIALANELANPSVIETGIQLTIPAADQKEPTAVTVSAPAAGQKISGSSYTVAKGDTLWDIAMRAYDDGYAWTNIWEANKAEIVNPGIIEIGQKLTLPR